MTERRLIRVGFVHPEDLRGLRPVRAPALEYDDLDLYYPEPHRYQPQAAGFYPPAVRGMGEAQSGLVMVHKIDADTDTRLNALVDKVSSVINKKLLMALLIAAVAAVLIGQYLATRKKAPARRRKRKA